MREIWESLDRLQQDRPESRRSNVWHVEKIAHEEIGELLEVTWNNPTPEQAREMLKEIADVLINTYFICLNSGITPEATSQAVLDKIVELGQRPELGGEIRFDNPLR